MKKVHRLPSAIIISSAVVVISWQLMLRPVVGLANNGDFGKVLGSFGLGAPREHEFRFADTKYDFDSRYFYKNGFFSSEFILVVPALALSAMLSRSGRFDLRHMGLIHGALFLLAIILFVRLLADLRRGAQYGLGLAVLFVFGDVAYVSYLNSFYMDVAAYLFMLLATVLYLRALRWRRRLDWVLLLISCLLLVTSKPQHAVLGFPLAMLFLAQKDEGRTTRAVWVAIGLGVAGTAVFVFVTPRRLTTRQGAVSPCSFMRCCRMRTTRIEHWPTWAWTRLTENTSANTLTWTGSWMIWRSLRHFHKEFPIPAWHDFF